MRESNLGRFGVGSGNPFDLIRRMVAPPVGCRAEHRNQRANACQLSAADPWLPSLSQLLTEAAAQRCESGWGYGSSPPSDTCTTPTAWSDGHVDRLRTGVVEHFQPEGGVQILYAGGVGPIEGLTHVA